MQLRRLLPLLLPVALAAAIAGALAAHMLAQKPLALQAGTWLGQPRALPPFELTDFNGRPYGRRELQGHASLLYFGYSSCPDVCPATLAAVRAALERTPLPGLQVLFVTVDPAQDSAARLRQYLGGFGPAFIGLRAGPAALAPLLASLAASADPAVQPLPGAPPRLDHTATLYLLDARGRLAAVFSPPLDAALLASDLRTLQRAALL